MTPFPFVVIDGIDGAGKTTAARMLAGQLGAHYYKTPSGIFERMRADIEALKDNLVRFSFYLTAVIHDSAEIAEILKKQPVICDRYIFSTVAYHKALGVPMSYCNIDELPILTPDFSFYLYADMAICAQRMKKRGITSSSDAMLERDKQLQQAIHEEFLRLPVVLVDSSTLSPEQVCETIMTHMA